MISLTRNLKTIFILVVLILLQIYLFNNIHFYGYANPYIYILFILFAPIQQNKYAFLFYTFLLGLGVDFLSQTGGVHAFASVAVAYLRLILVNAMMRGKPVEKDEWKLSYFNLVQWFIYLVIIIGVHHFSVNLIDNFKPDQFLTILERSGISAAITFVWVIIYLMIFPVGRRNDFAE